MLFYNGKQILESIDCIVLKLQPSIYEFLDLSKQVDKYNKISIISNYGKFNYKNELKIRSHHYLHISGEYINPEIPIIDTIAEAILSLINKGILFNGDLVNFYSKEDIIKDIFSYIIGIYKVEFCFDFTTNNIYLADNIDIIESSDDSLPILLKDDIRKRKKCLIRNGSTYYSYDFKKQRKSTVKFYCREEWLLNKNNEYKVRFIKNNPFKYRIEFVLTRNQCPYLTINNFSGNYHQVINNFIPYLAKQYNKYFLDKVFVKNPYLYSYFSRIYELAKIGIFFRSTLLNNLKDEKISIDAYFKNKYEELAYNKTNENHFNNNSINMKNIFDYLSDSYYASNNDFSKINYITPFDLQNEDKILLKDGDFIFMKDNYYLPDFKTIK